MTVRGQRPETIRSHVFPGFQSVTSSKTTIGRIRALRRRVAKRSGGGDPRGRGSVEDRRSDGVNIRCEATGEVREADGRQRIVPVRRDYNRWVADQTLEDYALRFTAKSARRWSVFRVANTRSEEHTSELQSH